MKDPVAERIMRQFDIYDVKSVEPIAKGLIHATFLVQTSSKKLILQRLHEALASDRVARDVLAVTQHLAANDIACPQVVLTSEGKPILDAVGARWRLQTYVKGQVFDSVRDPAMAYEAAGLLARVHEALISLRHRFGSPLHLHQSRAVLQRLRKVADERRATWLYREVAYEIDFVERELPGLLLPPSIPRKRVIHGDPKITNFVFDAKGRAVGIIDMDTCIRHTPLVDFGDAMRSWCGQAEDMTENVFNTAVFQAAWQGYAAHAAHLGVHERKRVPQAVGLIILELASRFLTDFFEDKYFGYDAKRYASRRDHNLARARGQIALYIDFDRKRPELEDFVRAS